jgi:hypothetical protein
MGKRKEAMELRLVVVVSSVQLCDMAGPWISGLAGQSATYERSMAKRSNMMGGFSGGASLSRRELKGR